MPISNVPIFFATTLSICLGLHDLINLPPLTNIEDLKTRTYIDFTINKLYGLAPLTFLLFYSPPLWAHRTIVVMYAIFLRYQEDVVPETLHHLLHLLMIVCFIFALEP